MQPSHLERLMHLLHMTPTSAGTDEPVSCSVDLRGGGPKSIGCERANLGAGQVNALPRTCTAPLSGMQEHDNAGCVSFA